MLKLRNQIFRTIKKKDPITLNTIILYYFYIF